MTVANPEVAVVPERGARQDELGAFAWVATVDHKRIGLLYLLTSLVFFAVGGVEALLIRIQLARPNAHFLLARTRINQMFTMHGTTMIFLVVMPALVGFANYFVPLMIGARDMAFPRLNAFSYLAIPVRRPAPPLQPLRRRRPVRRLVQLRARSARHPTAPRRGSTTGSSRSSCSESARSASAINIIATVHHAPRTRPHHPAAAALRVDDVRHRHPHHPRVARS